MHYEGGPDLSDIDVSEITDPTLEVGDDRSEEVEVEEIPEYLRKIDERRVYGKENREKQDVDPYLTHGEGQDVIEIGGPRKIVLIRGREKSRKSLFAACILMSAFIRLVKYTLGFKMNIEPHEVILHFDTEMDQEEDEERKELFNKICGIDPESDVYQFYNIEPYSYRQRREIITYVIQRCLDKGQNIGVVLIDQVADLVRAYDVNDKASASGALEHLQRWKEMADAMIMVIMHTNRGGLETSGWWGKILDDKCHSSFLLTYDEDSHETVVKHSGRKRRIQPFRFNQDRNGHPNYIKDESGLFITK